MPMQPNRWIPLMALALAGGCAHTGGAGGSAEAPASAHCQYFARDEGFEWVQTTKASAGAAELYLKDALGRPFAATCVHDGGRQRWAAPLPTNAIRRWESQDNIAPVSR
jgi:hypothetical protein